MDKDKKHVEVPWWEWLGMGEYGSCSEGWAMLSKSLSNFLLMDRAVFPPCCLIWGQAMVDVMVVMTTSLKNLCQHHCIQCTWPHSRPLSTHASTREPWTCTQASLAQSLVSIAAFFSWVLVHTRFGLFQIPWWFSNPLLDPQGGKSVVGPRTFVTVREVLWYSCFSSLWVICLMALC